MKSELNARQWAVYNLLKNNPDRYMTQKEIVYALSNYYATTFTDELFHDSHARITLTFDIRKINDSDVVQKIIISNHNGIKLASKEEYEEYIDAEFASIFRKLARTRKKARKAGLDKQMRIVFGTERDTIEAFSDSINRMKAARLSAGYKLAEVARELIAAGEKGIDVSLLSKMENGICNPTKSVLQKLSDLYGVDASLLVGEELHSESGKGS